MKSIKVTILFLLLVNFHNMRSEQQTLKGVKLKTKKVMATAKKTLQKLTSSIKKHPVKTATAAVVTSATLGTSAVAGILLKNYLSSKERMHKSKTQYDIINKIIENITNQANNARNNLNAKRTKPIRAEKPKTSTPTLTQAQGKESKNLDVSETNELTQKLGAYKYLFGINDNSEIVNFLNNIVQLKDDGYYGYDTSSLTTSYKTALNEYRLIGSLTISEIDNKITSTEQTTTQQSTTMEKSTGLTFTILYQNKKNLPIQDLIRDLVEKGSAEIKKDDDTTVEVSFDNDKDLIVLQSASTKNTNEAGRKNIGSGNATEDTLNNFASIMSEPPQGQTVSTMLLPAIVYRSCADGYKKDGTVDIDLDLTKDMETFENIIEELKEKALNDLDEKFKNLRHVMDYMPPVVFVGSEIENIKWKKFYGYPNNPVYMCQIPTFAVNLSGKQNNNNWEVIARKTLEKNYEATFKLAHYAGLKSNKRVLLFLTELGGGVFSNKHEYIYDALSIAMDKCSKYPLQVYLVRYKKAPKENKNIADYEKLAGTYKSES